MGIYIKGMEMPETCYECPCGDNEFYECMATKGRISYHRDEYGDPDGERQEWCPLVYVPPHGRCIDADAMMQQIEHDTPLSDVFEKTMRFYLRTAPTIIPAEEGE